jgi:hypothetical protein
VPHFAVRYGWALALTLVIEVPLVTAMVPFGRHRTVAAAAVAANLVTHPLLWFALLPAVEAAGWSGPAALGVAEVLVTATEAAWYRRVLVLPGSRALAVSFAANAMSLGVGLLVAARPG